MNDRRRPRTPAKPKPAPQLTGPVQLDDDTRNALILFNARLVAQDELEREKRRVDKASKAKDEAAATVRRLESDPKATAEQKSEAQAAYLASLDALNRAKSGEPATGDAPAAATDDDKEAAEEEHAPPTDEPEPVDEAEAETAEAESTDPVTDTAAESAEPAEAETPAEAALAEAETSAEAEAPADESA